MNDARAKEFQVANVFLQKNIYNGCYMYNRHVIINHFVN